MFNLGPVEMLIVMGIAVLLFGKRLPEVGRSLGKGIVEILSVHLLAPMPSARSRR